MKIESSTIGMESARSYKASRTSYNRFMLKDYVKGETDTNVAGQELGMGNEKEQSAQQSESGESSEGNRLLTRQGITDLRERVESMRATRIELRSQPVDTVNSMRSYTMRYIFMLLFGGDRTKSFLEEEENYTGVNTGNQSGNATLQLQPFNMKVLSFSTQECYTEQENTLFSSVGTVKTADGREISFNVDVSMSRSFTQTYQQELNLAAFQQTCDPLVINFDTDTATLEDQKFFFDVDADGEQDSISMLGAGSGYLALDQNGDGIINDGRELFGPRSGNGFQDLAAYDEDGNGWIDENDNIWSKLKIWCKNPDGSDSLYTLGEKGVGAICLQNAATDFSLKSRSNQDNGYIRSTGIFLYENGNVGTVQHLDLVQ